MLRLKSFLKKPALLISAGITALLVMLTPAIVKAGELSVLIKEMLQQAGDASLLPGDITQPNSLAEIIGNVIKVALTLLGIIFLVLIVYAGFVWILARGREEEVEKAQKIIETSIVGVVVVIIAYSITVFVFSVIESTGA